MEAKNITAKELDVLLQGDRPVLVDFWAPWCIWCRRIGPAYDKIARQYAGSLHTVKINTDTEQALAVREQIEMLPTLVLYQKGEALGSIVAPESKERIEEFLLETLGDG